MSVDAGEKGGSKTIWIFFRKFLAELSFIMAKICQIIFGTENATAHRKYVCIWRVAMMTWHGLTFAHCVLRGSMYSYFEGGHVSDGCALSISAQWGGWDSHTTPGLMGPRTLLKYVSFSIQTIIFSNLDKTTWTTTTPGNCTHTHVQYYAETSPRCGPYSK